MRPPRGAVAFRLLPSWLVVVCILSRCAAHMKLSYPLPINDPALGGSNPDYDETSPLEPNGSNFPCKGYANADWNPQASWTAGQTYNMSIAGGASHRGGSCQLSLSYDKQTFRVIKSMIGGCPLITTYDFTVPSEAPSGQALFAWTWQNEMGNREFYMNCAQVEIEGGVSNKFVRRADALANLPEIWVANLPGVNTCTTTEGIDPVYPAPGCSVEYGGKYNGDSPPGATSDPGECDFGSSQPTCPDGQLTGSAVQNPGLVMAEEPSSTSSMSMLALSTITDFGPSSTPSPTASDSPDSIASMMGGPSAEEQSPDGGSPVIRPLLGGPPAIQGPVGPPDGCAAEVTVTATAAARMVISSPRNSSAMSACNSNVDTVMRTAPSTTLTLRLTRTTPSTGRPYPPPISYRPTPLTTPSSPPTRGAEYAGDDVMAYMPCEPGRFLCSDADTFYTCDQSAGPDERWVWQYPRKVAAGMMCRPQLVACASGLGEGCSDGAGRVPAGYAREDEYVRAE